MEPGNDAAVAEHHGLIAALGIGSRGVGWQQGTCADQGHLGLAAQQGGFADFRMGRIGQMQIGIGDFQFGNHRARGHPHLADIPHLDAAIDHGGAFSQASGFLEIGFHGPVGAADGNAPQPKGQSDGTGNGGQ